MGAAQTNLMYKKSINTMNFKNHFLVLFMFLFSISFSQTKSKTIFIDVAPMDVKAYMTPSTSSISADGALNITVLNGMAPYTYLWSNGATTKDLYNKLPGIYTLIVTDSEGAKIKKNLIIGAENTEMTFTIIPDSLSGKDGLIKYASDGSLSAINYKNDTQIKSEKGNSGILYNTRSLIEFDLFCIPTNAIITNANLILYGNGHTVNQPNDCYLYTNTSAWDEGTVTWNNQPSHSTTNGIYLNSTIGAYENKTINVISQVQNWVQNPSSNFGWKLLLANEITNNNAAAVYGSSDNNSNGLRPNLVITISIPALTDAQRNWQLQETYNESEQVISSNKVYTDELGRPTQSLTKDALGNVFATQTVYDAYGRPAIKSLPAYSGNTLNYKNNFFLNTQGQEYNYTNFDISGKVTNPDAVQVGLSNALGTYYSDLNTLDTWQATSTNPYTRTHYMADPYAEVKTSNGPDNAFKAGSKREVRNYSMVCGNEELNYIFGSGNSYKVTLGTTNPLTNTACPIPSTSSIKASKSITTSPDNKEVISYSIGDKLIASCMSGLSSPDNCTITSVKNEINYYGTQSTDIHLPNAHKNSLSLPLPTYTLANTAYTVASSNINYVITDLTTETVLRSNIDYTINTSNRSVTFKAIYLVNYTGKPLFLRIRAEYNSAFIASLGTTLIPSAAVQYNLDYSRWSVNYYDYAGNLRKTVSAKGINCSNPGVITMATTYDYSHLGQLIATQSPDEGLTEVAYNTDGQARFTQNPEQKLNNRFSYFNFDNHGRPIENGEFSNLTGSGTNGVYFQNYYGTYTAPFPGNIATNTIIDNTDGLSNNYCNDVNYTSYESLNSTDDIPAAYTYSANYSGNYKNGQISKTWNNNASTWYKYDVAGRLWATIKQIKDADYISFAGPGDAQIKTFENAYNPYFGTITNSYFQKNNSNEYTEHAFTYDVNNRLSNVKFKTGSTAIATVNNLSYDKLGRLVRQVLGSNLQGVDYVYTINGALKAINHPSLNYAKDRGNDAMGYQFNLQGVKLDLFGEIIDYYPNDYIRTGTSIETNTIGLYNGQIYGTRYKTRDVVNGVNTGANYIDYMGSNQTELTTTANYYNQELANRYTYDAFGQLATSTFGTYTNTTNSFTPRTDYKEFGTNNNGIAYDVNGNITSLKRNAYNVTGNAQLLDDLTYNINSTGNKHTQVTDAASNSFPSSFNFKNQNSTAATFVYNTNGQLTASPDENVTAVSYYPNGQVKQINFTNNNITKHYYDDQGQKYKTTYFNAANSTTKYTWYVYNTIYEYITGGTFSLKETTIGGQGRIGVYKQDATGLNISTGHAEYELKDHLGNVRVTFKKGITNTLDVLSRTDYYAFGGAMPGRIWQQSGGDYRYGYQGQEKSQDATTWDNFELRTFNHDLGRWSAPDPYGQFHSPYVAMANNPIKHIDPDGGYINMSDEGQSQRAAFMSQQAYDRFTHSGRYSFAFLKANYDEAYQELSDRYNTSAGRFLYDKPGDKETNFLEDLLKLNNDFAGLGLSAYDYFKTGMDQVTLSTITNNFDLVGSILTQSGSWAESSGKKAASEQAERDKKEKADDAYAVNVFNSSHREYVSNWRENRDSKSSSKEAENDPKKRRHNNKNRNISFKLFGKTFSRSRYTRGWTIKGSNTLSSNKIQLALGFRIANIVIFDIRVNYDNKEAAPWDKNFPGRGGNGDPDNRAQIFYRVSKEESPNSYYEMRNETPGKPNHGFFGGYYNFFECYKECNFSPSHHN
jgi:RHS repeat-associated protein